MPGRTNAPSEARRKVPALPSRLRRAPVRPPAGPSRAVWLPRRRRARARAVFGTDAVFRVGLAALFPLPAFSRIFRRRSRRQICTNGWQFASPNLPSGAQSTRSILLPKPSPHFFHLFGGSKGERRSPGGGRRTGRLYQESVRAPAGWCRPAQDGSGRRGGWPPAAGGGRRAGARPRRLVVRLAGSSGGVGGFGSWRGGAGRGQKHPAGRATRRCGSWRRRVPSSAISTHARLPPCLGAPGASPHPCPYPAYSHAPASAALGLLRAKRLSVSALPYADAHAGTNGGRGAMPHVREREHRAGPRQAVADTGTARAARREGGSFSDICGGVAFGCGHRGGSHWGRAAGAACGARQQSRGRVRA